MISDIFDSIEQTTVEERKSVKGDYYSVFSKDACMLIRSDLFVMTVFSKGSDWAEKIFEKLFHPDRIETEIVEQIDINPEDTVFHVIADQQKFDYGIIIKSSFKEEIREKEGEKKEISLPVVVRIFSKTIPLSEIENMGETTEILISEQSQFEAELLVNGEVIGKGILRKDKNSFKLKILELFV